jgi:hypothetical protein
LLKSMPRKARCQKLAAPDPGCRLKAMGHDDARPAARTGFTALCGAAVGALASAPILVGASLLAKRMGKTPDPIAAGAGLGGAYVSFIVAVVVGAVLGALLGLAMVHSARLLARLIFAPVFSVVLYLCVHAVLVVRHAPTLPVVPMLVAAFVYGLCSAFAPPFERE